MAASCHGCGTSDGPSSQPVGDAGADQSDAVTEDVKDAGSDRDGAEADAADAACPAYYGSIPDAVPPGWEPWTCWDRDCPLWMPGEGAAMPPPIEWEPCPDPIPKTLSCRWMKLTWTTKEPTLNPLYTQMARDTVTGAVLLQFTRFRVNDAPGSLYQIIAEADGAVRHAALQTNLDEGLCEFFQDGFGGNRYVIATIKNAPEGPSSETRGMAAGSIDAPQPEVVFRNAPSTWGSHWYVSADWIVELSSGLHTARSWDLETTHTVYSSGEDPDGLPPHTATVVGADVFSDVSTLNRCGIMSWSEAAGSRPLLRKYGSTTWGAGNFGTDGVNMAWTQSEGASACVGFPSNPEVWTAPHTTDPQVVAASARRVRRDVRGMSPHPYAVGGGYAARAGSFGDPVTNALFIVRLVDGRAWKLAGDPNGQILNWGPGVLGITEDDIFVLVVGKGYGTRIARIRLDSLGPGEPAD